MEQQAKRAIKSLVLELRKKLEDDIAIQLKRYGFAGERWLPLERLSHIQQDDQATIDHFRLKAALEQHLRRIGADPKKATPQQRGEAVDWFVREVAFTHLNRLVALKCLEVRGLIPEIISVRQAYGGRSHAHHDYRNAHSDEARQPDDAFPAAIRHICRQVYAEFRFLFDVGGPATDHPVPANSIVWPSHPVLKECVGLINGLDDAAGHKDGTLWTEDEMIGWIYQFYNAEQKEAIRKRGRPRLPAEVAVINQFFTPRWIVKFLVDNTLGRLWLEMHPDSGRVRAKCDYLVPEPLGAGEEGGHGDHEREFRLDPDSPINDPKAPARREPKRPQDVLLIDPACGTMHFGHYAFEVFQDIYRDARDHGWVSGEDALPDQDIPEAILRDNLYGVDIDLRAVQLAGLSLFIKAKTANPRAHIAQLNLVVADAVLPADGARQQFLDKYKDDKVVQDAVRQVLEDMANVAEVGSLLRVEERLREILVKAGHAAVEDWDQDRLQELPGFDPPVRQLSLAETAGAVPEQWGAHYTLARLLEDLRAFAAEALQAHNLNAQLFAQEAEKTVHLLDVFLNEYDVVVMNPPYGFTTETAKSLLNSSFPDTSSDLYAAFMERGRDLMKNGFVGALVPRTFMYMHSLGDLREKVLLNGNSLIAVAEFGLGTLDDATVRPAGVVFSVRTSSRPQDKAMFFGLASIDDDMKNSIFEGNLQALQQGTVERGVFVHSLRRFQSLPRSAITYWASESLLAKFEASIPLDPGNASWGAGGKQTAMVRRGLGTGQDSRFVRFFWEVPPDRTGKDWPPFAKGGSISPYYRDLELAADWRNAGESLRKFPKSYLRSEHLYFREGLTYTLESEKDSLGAYYLRRGCIIGDKGPGVFPLGEDMIWTLLALLNSCTIAAYIRILTPDRTRTVGFVSSLPLPRRISDEHANVLSADTKYIFELKSSWDTGNEICTRFDVAWLVHAHRGTLLTDFQDLHPPESPANQLTSLLDYMHHIEGAVDARLEALQAEIDQSVYDLYELSADDRTLIERQLGDRPAVLVWPQMARKSDNKKRCEHVRRLISHFLLQALKEDRDGIIPITPGTGQPTALDEARRGMEAEFGEDAAFGMESDIKQVLGKSIADWLDGPFFKWHTKLYKRRPIIWHLASPGNAFGCLVYLHKLDRDTLRKVQTQYLWPRRRAADAELEAAKAEKDFRRIEQAEAVLDDLAEFEKRLLVVIQAQVECDIPDWAEGPFRGGVYDPVLDDGVKVNITPLQEGELLRHRKVV